MREGVFLLKNFLINNCLIDTFYIEIAEKSKSLIYKQMSIVSKVAYKGKKYIVLI